jgi:hypothetical protein
MSPLSLPNLLGASGFSRLDALLSLASIAGPALTYLGVRSSTVAPLQEALNGAFTSLMGELQTEHARLTVRVSELIAENDQLAGDLRQERQRMRSLIDLYRKSGQPWPPGVNLDDERRTPATET